MPHIKNVSSLGDLDVPSLRRTVKAGETVEVPADISDVLAQQPDVWSVVNLKEGK